MAQEKNPSAKTIKGWIFIIVTMELALSFLAVPQSWIQSIGVSDRGLTALTLGAGYEKDILAIATHWYVVMFVDTHIIQSINNFLFAQWEHTNQIPIDDRGFSQFVKNRLDATWAAIFIATYRLAETWSWLPYILPLGIPAIIDGITRRSINKWRYFSPSPLTHRACVNTTNICIIILILMPFAPFPFPVVLIPILLLALALAAMIFTGNLSKHI